MTMLGCAEVREVAPELALDVLIGSERADALAHMSECSACRSLLGELTEVVDAVPLLVAEAQPPSGFQNRVLQQMSTRARRTRRRWPALLAAAAAFVLVVTATAVLVQGRGSETRVAADSRQVRPASGDARSTTMVGAGGEQVGRIFTTPGDTALLMVSVNYGVPSGTYSIEQRTGDGTAQQLGQMQVSDGHGTWGGVTARGVRPVSVALIDAHGVVLCQARVPEN
ncbi:MAG: hypothetical protein M3046_02970 [Actinomycetota bacterium]|nr:hypothetical protein [Actinomycetota bacterium]